MTNHQTPNPLPENAMLVDATGAPIAMMNIDQMQSDSIALAYDMARNSHDEQALDESSVRWLNKIGADAFGYVAAGALRTMTHYILDPTLATVEKLAPGLGYRQMLDDAYRNAATATAVTPEAVDAPAPSAATGSWGELPDDPAHPTPGDVTRFLIARHTLDLHHDVDDKYERVTTAATYVNGLGEQIELGPWSMTTREARQLAAALLDLAATVDARNS
ncbi:hypothetical protein [Rhodococcus sp. SGAir0479]|uniref:hypothetical protein n=1 Tax=Rhodococcus sp. SGAir0479 TaxID=2567884 RepID=UPI0010CD278C|nr:hypothetical protein [Rhodococcus sp. SGAir0479]QCQ93035.1 hypothetical protein E7742_18625 [Rhodococcus sp. SGAir0479]